MRIAFKIFILIMFLAVSSNVLKAQMANETNICIVIHGGAGNIRREGMSAAMEKAHTAKMEEALNAAYDTLSKGGNSIAAVEIALRIMENSGIFNAGRGAVFTNDGKNELDASIMDGSNLKAGAVAGLRTVRNPISAARAVMERSVHVMMAGRGAERFAAECGLEVVDSTYFLFNDERLEQKKKIEKKLQKRDTSGFIYPAADSLNYKFGTVGAVAIDRNGNMAAATSTGGMSNKKFGRVGDSPIIGAGTYADNNTCAVSCTGHGEFFIRNVVAYDVSALIKYRGLSLDSAARTIIMYKLLAIGGEGGLIALDRYGNISMPFNTPGMFRGYRKEGGKAITFMFKD
jgi:beta-aspartyl-peptidase (threonine type)